MGGVATGKYKGCETCRKRRVKCDNERPACRKCTKGGRTCEGYFRPPTFITRGPEHEGRVSIHPKRVASATASAAPTPTPPQLSQAPTPAATSSSSIPSSTPKSTTPILRASASPHYSDISTHTPLFPHYLQTPPAVSAVLAISPATTTVSTCTFALSQESEPVIPPSPEVADEALAVYGFTFGEGYLEKEFGGVASSQRCVSAEWLLQVGRFDEFTNDQIILSERIMIAIHNRTPDDPNSPGPTHNPARYFSSGSTDTLLHYTRRIPSILARADASVFATASHPTLARRQRAFAIAAEARAVCDGLENWWGRAVDAPVVKDGSINRSIYTAGPISHSLYTTDPINHSLYTANPISLCTADPSQFTLPINPPLYGNINAPTDTAATTLLPAVHFITALLECQRCLFALEAAIVQPVDDSLVDDISLLPATEFMRAVAAPMARAIVAWSRAVAQYPGTILRPCALGVPLQAATNVFSWLVANDERVGDWKELYVGDVFRRDLEGAWA